MEPDYFALNLQAWDNRVAHHLQSEFYGLEKFKSGSNPLNGIELSLLGDVSGSSVLHLQCHFGMDTLAMARMGAKVTGLDFSAEAITQANTLATDLQLPATFVCSNVYDTRKHIKDTFDIVFTSYGTIGWLPELQQWARVISESLRPGGKFIMADFHPVLWMYDSAFTYLKYSYFNRETIIEETEGSYADRNAPTEKTAGWNHSLQDIFGALLAEGLVIRDFQEYDYSPYPCFEKLIQSGDRKYQIEHLAGKIPMVYSVVAVKPASGPSPSQ